MLILLAPRQHATIGRLPPHRAQFGAPISWAFTHFTSIPGVRSPITLATWAQSVPRLADLQNNTTVARSLRSKRQVTRETDSLGQVTAR